MHGSVGVAVEPDVLSAARNAGGAPAQDAAGDDRPARRVSSTRYVMMGMIRIATMLATLIIGLIAGPAVSLNGSPTVSPVTEAACASEPLPPNAPTLTTPTMNGMRIGISDGMIISRCAAFVTRSTHVA